MHDLQLWRHYGEAGLVERTQKASLSGACPSNSGTPVDDARDQDGNFDPYPDASETGPSGLQWVSIQPSQGLQGLRCVDSIVIKKALPLPEYVPV